MNIKLDNRRKFSRIIFDGKARLQFVDNSYTYCKTQNISIGGMFISGIFSQKKAENCQICLFHNAKSGCPGLAGSATVIWNNNEGIGLKFTSMTYVSYMVLLTTLINNAEQPALILHGIPKDYPFEINSN